MGLVYSNLLILFLIKLHILLNRSHLLMPGDSNGKVYIHLPRSSYMMLHIKVKVFSGRAMC